MISIYNFLLHCWCLSLIDDNDWWYWMSVQHKFHSFQAFVTFRAAVFLQLALCVRSFWKGHGREGCTSAHSGVGKLRDNWEQRWRCWWCGWRRQWQGEEEESWIPRQKGHLIFARKKYSLNNSIEYDYEQLKTRVRTILVLGYWVLGNIHRYWVVLLLGDIFCCSDTQYDTNQRAVSTIHMPVNDYLVPLLTCTLTDAIVCLDTMLIYCCLLNTIIVLLSSTQVSVLVLGIGIARGQYYWVLDIGCLSWYRSNTTENHFLFEVISRILTNLSRH